jgi:hypothetical protein
MPNPGRPVQAPRGNGQPGCLQPQPGTARFGLGMRLTRITILFSVALPMLAGSFAAAQPYVFSAGQQLATEFMRGALSKAAENPPSTGSLELATIMAAQAIELEANDVELCRYALAVAMTSENDELKAKAVDLIAQLDPRDEVVRLMRINRVLDRSKTVQERIDAYQHLLSPQSVAALGRPAASRLAFDLALLHQRSGNTQQFAQWIPSRSSLIQPIEWRLQ